jgi:hypothetical protein
MKVRLAQTHTCLAIATVGAVLLAFAPRAAAQNAEPNPSMPFTVSGKIGKISPGKFQLDTGGNVFFVVRYTSATRIERPDGSAGSASDLKIGTEVHVKGDLAENGDVHAKTIRMEAGKGKKPAEE